MIKSVVFPRATCNSLLRGCSTKVSDFGFKNVPQNEKQDMVKKVFDKGAPQRPPALIPTFTPILTQR